MLALAQPDFVDGHNVGVLEAGRSSRLGLKALDELRASLRSDQQHLERNNAPQALLPSLGGSVRTDIF